MGTMGLVAVLTIAFCCIAAMLLLVSRRNKLVYSDEDLVDIVPLLLPVDMDRLENFFDAGAEWTLRCSSNARQFRSWQRSRRKIAVVHVGRIFRNAALLQKLGYAALREPDEQQMQLGKAMIDAGATVRVHATVLLILLRLQRFISPSSSLSAANKVFGQLHSDYAALRSFCVELVHRRNASFDAEVARLL